MDRPSPAPLPHRQHPGQQLPHASSLRSLEAAPPDFRPGLGLCLVHPAQKPQEKGDSDV